MALESGILLEVGRKVGRHELQGSKQLVDRVVLIK